MITKDGFTITHRDSVVTVQRSCKNGESFDLCLEEARNVLHCFKQKGGSEWGCDGVGYEAQKKIGLVRINRSGVSPKAFLAGCEEVKAR